MATVDDVVKQAKECHLSLFRLCELLSRSRDRRSPFMRGMLVGALAVLAELVFRHERTSRKKPQAPRRRRGPYGRE